MDIGSAVGRDKGVKEEQLHALSEYRTSPHFSELERLALRLADAMAATPAEVPLELYQALRAHLDEAQVVELASAIALENFRARFNRVFEIGSDNFSEGATCAVPVRPAARGLAP
jgi:alkylhydroperoxidase family enzyme